MLDLANNNKHDNLIHLSVVDPRRSSVDSHESNEPLNSDKTAPDSSSFGAYDDQELQFRTDHHENNMDVDDSGPSSPTLWNRELHPHHPTSRAQAIAKGQREMMEIVNNMPESSYELSLKDIVDHHHPIRLDDEEHVTQEQYLIQERNTYYDYRVQQEQHRAKKVIKRQVSVKTKMVRSGSVDNNRGLFLKMVFPFTWKQSHKSTISSSSSSSTTLPTKHVTLTKTTSNYSDDEVLEKSLMGRRRQTRTNTIDKDLSTRRFSSGTCSSSSSNGTNSSSSGSSNTAATFKITNRRSGLLNNYCSCFQSRKTMSAEYDT